MVLLERVQELSRNPLITILAKLELIKALMTNIFNQTPPEPYNITATEDAFFTDHGREHTQRIIEKMELLLVNYELNLNGFESFILLSTSWLHDVGMFLGGTEGESSLTVRAVHAERSTLLIDTFLANHSIRLDDESQIIKDIIQAHSSHYPIEDLTNFTRIEGFEIKIKLLGAILRLSDACDCDKRRAPTSIYKLYFRFISPDSIEHWERVFPITDVNFDKTRSSIILHANLSQTVFEKISQYINLFYLKQELENELSSIENILNTYAIYLREVEIKLFNSNNYINLTRFPFENDYFWVSLKSKFKNITELAEILDRYIVDDEDGLNVVIEITPPDGPVYINLDKKIMHDQAQNLNDELEARLGGDFIRTDASSSRLIRDE